MITRGHQDSAEQQEVRQELRKYAPQVLAATRDLAHQRTDLWSSKWLWSTMKFQESWLAPPALAADIKRSLVWLLWEPAFDQSAAAAAAAGSGQLLAREIDLPLGCSLQWLPGSMQLLTPELFHCLLELASSSDYSTFVRHFLAHIAGPQGTATLLKAPQQVHHLAPFAAATLQALQRARWQHDAATGQVLYGCIVLLLQCMMPLSGSRQGLIALAPHTELLSKAAAVLPRVPATFVGELPVQQVDACRNWAEQTAAAAAAALQESKQQHAEAHSKMMDKLVSGVAPAYAEMRSSRQQQHVALHKFVAAAVEFGLWAAREEQLKKLLQLAEVAVEA